MKSKKWRFAMIEAIRNIGQYALLKKEKKHFNNFTLPRLELVIKNA